MSQETVPSSDQTPEATPSRKASLLISAAEKQKVGKDTVAELHKLNHDLAGLKQVPFHDQKIDNNPDKLSPKEIREMEKQFREGAIVLNDTRNDLNTLEQLRVKGNLLPAEIDQLNALYDSYEQLVKQYNELWQTYSVQKELEAKKAERDEARKTEQDFSDIPANWAWTDIPLTIDQINAINPVEFLGKTKDGNRYFRVTINSVDFVLRLLRDQSEELSLLKIDNLANASADWHRYIYLNEDSSRFQDIEIDGSGSLTTGLIDKNFTGTDLEHCRGLKDKLSALEK